MLGSTTLTDLFMKYVPLIFKKCEKLWEVISHMQSNGPFLD